MSWGDFVKDMFKGMTLHSFLIWFEPLVVETFQKGLATYSAEDIAMMLTRGEFPKIEDRHLSEAMGFEHQLEQMDLALLAEYVIKARPDIGELFEAIGPEATARYLATFKQDILERLYALGNQPAAPAPAPASTPPPAEQKPLTLGAKTPARPITPPEQAPQKTQKMLTLVCDECNETFYMTPEEFEELNRCPYCQCPVK